MIPSKSAQSGPIYKNAEGYVGYSSRVYLFNCRRIQGIITRSFAQVSGFTLPVCLTTIPVQGKMIQPSASGDCLSAQMRIMGVVFYSVLEPLQKMKDVWLKTTSPTIPPRSGSVIRAWKPWRSLGPSDRGNRKIFTRATHVCPIWATLSLDSVTKENGVSYQVSVIYSGISFHKIKSYILTIKWRWLHKAWICCGRMNVLILG